MPPGLGRLPAFAPPHQTRGEAGPQSCRGYWLPPLGTAVRAPESPPLLEPPLDPEPDEPCEYPLEDAVPELPDQPAAEPLAPPLLRGEDGSASRLRTCV